MDGLFAVMFLYVLLACCYSSRPVGGVDAPPLSQTAEEESTSTHPWRASASSTEFSLQQRLRSASYPEREPECQRVRGSVFDTLNVRKAAMNSSKHDNRDFSETEPVTGGGCEADGLELLTHTSSIRVEYYRSFEYYLKWQTPMNTSRTLKSRKRSPSPVEELIQRKLSGKRRRTGLWKTESSNSVINAVEDKGRDILDIIDIIDSTKDAKSVAEGGEVKFVEVADKGVDESDEDCISVTSSVASGPSTLYKKPKTQKPRQGMCSACLRLYQKAKRMKAPIKKKLLDNDPQSLTCDQWVLIKTWNPRRLPNTRGKLLTHVQVLKKRLKVKKGVKHSEQHVGESSACSRPHTFLQRNLRQRVRVPVKKERSRKRRKRTRDEPQGPRITKQLRVHLQRLSSDVLNCKNGFQPVEGHISCPDFEACGDYKINGRADSDFKTTEVTPLVVAMETTKPNEVPPKQKVWKKTGGFRDLLAQLRSNSSMIVRENR